MLNARTALKLETLEKLATSHDHDLRSAFVSTALNTTSKLNTLFRAVKIISERSTKGPSFKLLLKHLASNNPREREKALTAVWFLLSNKSRTLDHIFDRFLPSLSSYSTPRNSPPPTVARSPSTHRLQEPGFATALTICLINIRTQHPPNHSIPSSNNISTLHLSPVLPPYPRPTLEPRALRVLDAALRLDIYPFLTCGLIPRWLADYSFPCARPSWPGPSKKCDVVELFKTWWGDDPVMGEIVGLLSCHPEGRKQLRRCGLMPPLQAANQTPLQQREHIVEFSDSENTSNDEDGEDNDSDVYMTNSDDTAGVVIPTYGDSPSMSRSRPQRRRRDESLEEQALRRRRREAMVLSEGGRPLGQDNIIQRPVNGSVISNVAETFAGEINNEMEQGEIGEDDAGDSLEQQDKEQVEEELEQLVQEVMESAGDGSENAQPPEEYHHNGVSESESMFLTSWVSDLFSNRR